MPAKNFTAILAAGLLTSSAVAFADTCRMASFTAVGCSTALGLDLARSATNSAQLQSAGCISLNNRPVVDVVNRIGQYSLVSINTAKAIVPFWVRSSDLDCSAVPSGVPSTTPSLPRSDYDRTEDGYVWKHGTRIGWVDPSETFYRLDQLVDGRSSTPAAKAGEKGRKVTGTLDFSVIEAQQEAAKPPGWELERTGDGFVWRDGKRVGWVDSTGSAFYRLDQLDFTDGQLPSPRSGQTGTVIQANNLTDAVRRALP
jgi:hypothetical protein